VSVTSGTNIEHLYLSKNLFSFPVAVNNSIKVRHLIFLLQMFVITENIMKRPVYVPTVKKRGACKMTSVLFTNKVCYILCSDQITGCHYNEVPVSNLVKAIRCAHTTTIHTLCSAALKFCRSFSIRVGLLRYSCMGDDFPYLPV
jgi:hypothetical protein